MIELADGTIVNTWQISFVRRSNTDVANKYAYHIIMNNTERLRITEDDYIKLKRDAK